MASTTEYEKYDSAVDDIISIVYRSYFGKTVDDEFLSDLKLLIEKTLIYSNIMKPVTDPVKPVLKTELECLPMPNEILVKIFGYLNIEEISCCAQVSHQFNTISKDFSLWQSWGKLCMDDMKVPTDFLTYIIQRGITGISLLKCEILPPRVKLTELKPHLKTLSLDGVKGDKTLLNEIITSHPMEEVHFRECMSEYDPIQNTYSEFDISQFIRVLPQIGSQLRSLNLQNGLLGKFCDLISISSIVNTCLSLEELNLSGNSLNEEAISYLCENLTSNILKLNIDIGGWRKFDEGLYDNNIRALVKSCPKLKILDIRCNENVTYQSLVAICDGLHFLECLGLPDSIGDELGLPNNINLSKMDTLKSKETLKELRIGNCKAGNWGNCNYNQSILMWEMPHLRKHNCYHDFEVAMINREDFRRVECCPICHEYIKYCWDHECLEK